MYHTDQCRWRAGQKERQAVHRLGELAETMPSDPPASPFPICDPSVLGSVQGCWREVFAIDGDLYRKGPIDIELNRTLLGRAFAVQARLPHIRMRESARSRLLARTSEIIFDIGGSSEEGLKSVLGFGWQAARIYRAGKDKLPLARIVMSLASGYRLVGDARLSRSLSGTAHHILDRFADRSRQEDLELLQRALMSQLRHHLESGIRQTEMEKIRRMLINITTTVDSAYAKVEAEKELLGYCAQFDEKIAPQKSLEFKELVSNTPGLPKFGGAGRWRPDIERLILEGDRIGASEIMTGPFLSAFQEEPHLHYRRLLVEWNEDYDLGIEQELSRTPAQYVSPIQMSAPRRPQD